MRERIEDQVELKREKYLYCFVETGFLGKFLMDNCVYGDVGEGLGEGKKWRA